MLPGRQDLTHRMEIMSHERTRKIPTASRLKTINIKYQILGWIWPYWIRQVKTPWYNTISLKATSTLTLLLISRWHQINFLTGGSKAWRSPQEVLQFSNTCKSWPEIFSRMISQWITQVAVKTRKSDTKNYTGLQKRWERQGLRLSNQRSCFWIRPWTHSVLTKKTQANTCSSKTMMARITWSNLAPISGPQETISFRKPT